MKYLYLLITLLLIQTSTSAQCYSYLNKNINISWTAYKTPLKMPVKGTFKKMTITTKKQQGSFNELLTNASFKIDTSSISTNNKVRDKTILNSFFKDVEIKGQVLKVTDKTIEMMLNLNSRQHIAIMTYDIKNNQLHATGVIDILDFMMDKNLTSLNNACKMKHEGKTWSDVSIELSATLSSCK